MKSIDLFRRQLFVYLPILLLVWQMPARGAGPQYKAIDLGTLGGASSYPSAINNEGEIVGATEIVNPNYTAFYEISGTMKSLGTLGGTGSIAFGVSDNALFVGSALTTGSAEHAFKAVGLPMTDINLIGADSSVATCVNSAGAIAGSYTISGTGRAFSIISGTVRDLGTLGGDMAEANGINASNEIVGESALAGDAVSHAFAYSSGTMTDLGVLSTGTFSEAIGVNDAGQVTGGSEVPFVAPEHAFLYTSGSMKDLGTPGAGFLSSRGFAVNNEGQVAGSLETTGSIAGAFLYTSGTMYDMNTLVTSTSGVLTLNYVSMGKVLNDFGQLTANAPVGGFQHAFLLNPVAPYVYKTTNASDTKFIQGMNFGLFTPVTGTGTSFGSTSQILDGTATANRDVNVIMQDDTTAPVLPATGLASDIVNTSGFGNDLHVVQVSYDPATVISDFINPANVQLDWYNSGTGKWVNAAQAGTASVNTFVNGAYNSATDLQPGFYGIDLVHHVVWAVVQNDGLYSAAAGTTLAIKLVAGDGDAVESGSATLVAAGSPAISGSGVTAFRATLKHTSGTPKSTFAVIGFDAAGNSAVFAETGQVDPISSTNYEKVSDPVAGAGSGIAAEVTVESNGTTVPESGKVRIERYDTLPAMAFPTNAAILNGAGFRDFAQLGVYDTPGVVVLGDLHGTGVNPSAARALCVDTGTGAQVLMQDEITLGGLVTANVKSFTVLTPLPFIGGQGRSVSEEAACAAALAKLSTGATAVTLFGLDQNTITAFTGEAFPGMQGVKISGLHEPAVNDTETESFALTLSGNGVTSHNNSAVAVLTASNGISLVARTGSAAPDSTGTAALGVFAKVSDPVLNENDSIAFVGSLLTGGTTGVAKNESQGIWLRKNGTLREIVRQEDVTPGLTGGDYTGFQQVVLPSTNEPLFEATYAGGQRKKGNGVWVATDHNGILPIVFTGQSLHFHTVTKTVSSISIFNQPSTSLGATRSFDPESSNTVFEVNFTDHTWGIYEAAFN